MQRVESGFAVSVSELKRNPTRIMSGSSGKPVAILNHNRIMAYMLEPEIYEAMLERLDDLDLIEIAKARATAKPATPAPSTVMRRRACQPRPCMACRITTRSNCVRQDTGWFIAWKTIGSQSLSLLSGVANTMTYMTRRNGDECA